MAVLLLIGLVVLGSVGVAGQPAVPPAAPPTYAVGANDVLAIKIYDEPALSGSFRVDPDGSITYPLLGRVAVAGQTVRAIEEDLTRRLSEGFLRRPQVAVEIAEFRSRNVFIMGEVRSPGKYAIEGEVTLLEVLARAGSFTPAAGTEILVRRARPGGVTPAAGTDDEVEVLRVGVNDLYTGSAAFDLVLQDGDTIIVEQAPRFYIAGFVRNPGFYVLQPNMTVQQAIAVAGGLSERGSNRGIKVQRIVDGKPVEVGAKLTDLVQPNDTIRIRQRYL